MKRAYLVSVTPDADFLVAYAARICYSPDKGSDMIDQIDSNTINKMITTARENHHDSLFEHINFTFLIENISRSLSHQLVRHRLCTFHQSSQRYVKVENLVNNVIIPDSIKRNPEALETFNSVVKTIQEVYTALIDNGIPKEDARYILPNATSTQLLMTINARNLIHILRLRLCNRAMPEFRKLAEEILIICRKELPAIFNFVGPGCFMDGKCPEGRMCCGNETLMKARYNPDFFDDFRDEEL